MTGVPANFIFLSRRVQCLYVRSDSQHSVGGFLALVSFLAISIRRDMRLCRHHLKFFQPGSPLLVHRSIYTRLSPERLSQPSSQTPTTTHSPSNSGVEFALTKNTTRTIASSTVSPPEAPVSSQNFPFPKREIINSTSPYARFAIVAGLFLRHTARSVGFQVLPDGFVRVSDMVHFSSSF